MLRRRRETVSQTGYYLRNQTSRQSAAFERPSYVPQADRRVRSSADSASLEPIGVRPLAMLASDESLPPQPSLADGGSPDRASDLGGWLNAEPVADYRARDQRSGETAIDGSLSGKVKPTGRSVMAFGAVVVVFVLAVISVAEAQSRELCLLEEVSRGLPAGFQIDGISRAEGLGFLLWDRGPRTRFLLVRLVQDSERMGPDGVGRVRIERTDDLPEAPTDDLAGASFHDQRLVVVPREPDARLTEWAEAKLRVEAARVPKRLRVITAVWDGREWRTLHLAESGSLEIGTIRGDSMLRSDALHSVRIDSTGSPVPVHPMVRRGSDREAISFSTRPYQRYVYRPHGRGPQQWTSLPGAVDSVRSPPAADRASPPAHWRALALVPLDRGGALQTFADLRSDRRVLVRYDSTGVIVAERELDAPFATLHSIPERRLLLGSRSLGASVELVVHSWDWAQGIQGCTR